jgi:hypothetical protein
MKAHNGMRPHDVVVLLKILILNGQPWQYRDLSASLHIAISEIAESLNRNHMAGLIDKTKRNVHRQSLMEFIEHGLHYVFPQVPGAMVIGYPTGLSHPFYKTKFSSELEYVWPDEENGFIRGQMIQPLYKNASKASQADQKIYKMLASIDIIRVGKNREIAVALQELKKEIL